MLVNHKHETLFGRRVVRVEYFPDSRETLVTNDLGQSMKFTEEALNRMLQVHHL